jgi:hypothetical protein
MGLLDRVGVQQHNYHDTLGSFPIGSLEARHLRNRDGSLQYPHGVQIAWSALLLPFVEQMPLHDRVDFGQGFDSPANARAAATIVPIYVCPSVPRAALHVDRRAVIDYGGIYGERITGRNDPAKGTMLYTRAITVDEIDDGTSYTLIVSEDSGWRDGQWINGRNIFDQAFPINQAPPFENDIRSEHPNGALGLFCDGSVRFLYESMELKPLAAVCTRAGGEIITGL